MWFVNNSGVNTGGGTYDTAGWTPSSVVDWYDQQNLGLTNSTVYWKSLAPKPASNVYVTDRNGEGDGIHVAVVDDFGTISGVQGAILEKHIALSKAEDTISAVNSPQKIYYKQYLADFSDIRAVTKIIGIDRDVVSKMRLGQNSDSTKIARFGRQ